MKPVLVSVEAETDISAAASYYAEHAGLAVAHRFLDALETALPDIGKAPGTGSTRLREIVPSEKARTRDIARFPYVIIYDDLPDGVNVLRILHMSRDIPASLRPE